MIGDWRARNDVSEWEAFEVGRLLVLLEPRDIALLYIRLHQLLQNTAPARIERTAGGYRPQPGPGPNGKPPNQGSGGKPPKHVHGQPSSVVPPGSWQSKGGRTRAERLTPKRRSDIARKAAQARWGSV